MCRIRPLKAEIHHTRLKVDGSLIKYLHNVSAATLEISKVNFLLNSFISTPNAKLCGEDIKYFYVNTPMDTYKDMRTKAFLTRSK